MMYPRTVLALLMAWLTGCTSAYLLVKPEETYVAGTELVVTPTSAWNMVPADASHTVWEEVWTRNGPLLDTVAFIGGLPDGKSVLVQRKSADRQVPLFHANMTPQDLASMVETSYRINGVTVFNLESADPVQFLGGTGLKVRYSYAPGSGITKKGSCVMRVVDNKLYVAKLEGVASHYFDAALPEFDQIVASARLQKPKRQGAR
jgi:hypothetical protein